MCVCVLRETVCLHRMVFFFLSLPGETLIWVVQRPPGIIRHTFIHAVHRQHGCWQLGCGVPTNLHPQARTLYLRQFNIDSIPLNTLQTKFLWRPTPSVQLLAGRHKFVELRDTVSGAVRESLTCHLNTLRFYKTSRRPWQVWLCMTVMPARWQWCQHTDRSPIKK